jgi:hypothetical protein
MEDTVMVASIWALQFLDRFRGDSGIRAKQDRLLFTYL